MEKRIGKTILFWMTFLTSFFYIGWRALYTLPVNQGFASLFWGVLLLVAETTAIVEVFCHFNNVRHVRIPEMPVLSEEQYPDVDVLISTHNETEELLFKTLNGCNYMDYPDKSKVHVYLCDDRNRPEIKALAERMGAGYFGFDGNKHAKAGNLNYALPYTKSPLVAIFDADMIPTRDFLLETVPYFFLTEMIEEDGVWRKREADEVSERKELGYVQTQQSFYNADPIQKNLYMEKHAPNEQDYFYRSVNVARTHSEAAAFAGSNTLFSRKALEEVGGFATYSITEDLATSIPILANGYTSIAVDKELAHGLSPEDAFSFIKQRQRWSRGSAQVIPNRNFLGSKLSLKAKWSFIVSYFYWWTFLRRLIYTIAPIICILFGVVMAKTSLQELLLIWLPAYLIYNTGLSIMSHGTISSFWSSVVDTIQFPYLIWSIIAGTLGIPEKNFWVTPKDKVKGRNSNVRLAWPHLILLVLSLIALVSCIYSIINLGYHGPIIVAYWLVYNIILLSISIVYYVGRVNEHDYEQIPAVVAATIQLDNQKIETETTIVADDGMVIQIPLTLENKLPKSFTITLQDDRYQATMYVRVKVIKEIENKLEYSLFITGITEQNKREYLQIVYDRNHSFGRKVNTNLFSLIGMLIENKMKEKASKDIEVLQEEVQI